MSTNPGPAPHLVIFDLDGVVYRGEQAIPGAAALISALRAEQRLVRFATNNSMYTRAEFVERLGRMGIVTQRSEVVTSTSATIDHLRAHLPDVKQVLAVGEAGMLSELEAAGFAVTAVDDAAAAGWTGAPLDRAYDAVVAGLDRAIDYRRVGIAAAAIRAGARFIATNADLRFATPDGLLPGAGTIIAALEATTGVEPLIIGKPGPAMFTSILEAAGIGPKDALVIGDNPDSDIVAARRAGVPSVLVLTGVTDATVAAELRGERQPDHVARDMAELAGLLKLPVR